MNLSVIIAYAVLLFEMIFIIAQGGENMTSEIIAAIIAGIVAIVVAVIGNVVTFSKGRHNEKNEHDNLEKGHEELSEGQDSILEAQKEHTSYLASLTEKNQETLQHLSDESIRMSEMQKQVKERGVDTEKMIANIQALVQMNTDQSQQLRQMTEERNSLLMEKDCLLSENISLRVQRDQLESQLKQKEREERNRQVQEWDDLEW